MVKLVTAYLIVTGILAMAALLVPSLVVIGTFLLILPGLILAAVPIIGRIMEEHLRLLAERRNSKKRHYDDSDIIMVDRARMALCQLGPEGNAALPLIARLEAEGLVDRRLGSIAAGN